MAKHPFGKNCEPTIDELLNDHIAGLLMARDGIGVADVRQVLENTKAALRLRDE